MLKRGEWRRNDRNYDHGIILSFQTVMLMCKHDSAVIIMNVKLCTDCLSPFSIGLVLLTIGAFVPNFAKLYGSIGILKGPIF